MTRGVATGANWKRKISFVEYDIQGSLVEGPTRDCFTNAAYVYMGSDLEQNRNQPDENPCWIIEHHDGERISDFTQSVLPDAYDSMQLESVRCYAQKLKGDNCIRRCFPWLYPVVQGILKHHFIELRTISGHYFSLEKLPDSLLLQRSPCPLGSKEPMVRTKRNGKKRVFPHEILTSVVEDKCPRNFNMNDVIHWIQSSGQLRDAYHIVDSNCQHFVTSLWSQLSNKPYPSPSRFDDYIQRMNNIQKGNICNLLSLQIHISFYNN